MISCLSHVLEKCRFIWRDDWLVYLLWTSALLDLWETHVVTLTPCLCLDTISWQTWVLIDEISIDRKCPVRFLFSSDIDCIVDLHVPFHSLVSTTWFRFGLITLPLLLREGGLQLGMDFGAIECLTHLSHDSSLLNDLFIDWRFARCKDHIRTESLGFFSRLVERFSAFLWGHWSCWFEIWVGLGSLLLGHLWHLVSRREHLFGTELWMLLSSIDSVSLTLVLFVFSIAGKLWDAGH